tara:strand:+ start:885 stop:1031 length:147 start_codon:yes stop_codon:yes gene_type:complete
MTEDYWEHEKLIQLEEEKQKEKDTTDTDINQMVLEFFTSITDTNTRRK